MKSLSLRKKEVELRGRKLVIINDGGKFYCVNGICSHYNYPLVNGESSALSSSRVSQENMKFFSAAKVWEVYIALPISKWKSIQPLALLKIQMAQFFQMITWNKKIIAKHFKSQFSSTKPTDGVKLARLTGKSLEFIQIQPTCYMVESSGFPLKKTLLQMWYRTFLW